MILWFAIMAPVLVGWVFKSPMLDYRIVSGSASLGVLGVVLPVTNITHTLFFPVVILALVMVLTTGRRLLRRRLLGVPIGLFCHLVLDLSWAQDSNGLWWPFATIGLDQIPVPEVEHMKFTIVADLVAVTMGYFAVKRSGLLTKQSMFRFVKTGHLPKTGTVSL